MVRLSYIIVSNNRVFLAALLILSTHVGLLAYSASRHSPTMNEPAHLVAGLSHWKFGRFELYRVNPPLTRMLAALPLMFVEHEEDWSGFYDGPAARPVFDMGADFTRVNGERSVWLFKLARWACIPISLFGALTCFCWACELWRTPLAGLLAMTLWCFDPSILAHAELITPDCAAASFGIGAAYCFWRWLKFPTWRRACLSGVLLGLAELSKLSWTILFVLWPLMWIAWVIFHRSSAIDATPSIPSRQASCPPVSQLFAICCLAIYVINVTYGFDGTLTRLGDYQFASSLLTGHQEVGKPGNRFKKSVFANVPIPLPREYIRGIDVQRQDLEEYRKKSYLRGEWKNGGWWYYYLYGLCVKAPHGTQLLLLLSLLTLTCSTMRNARKHCCHSEPSDYFCDLMILLVPPSLLLLIVSAHIEFNHHLRYVLPVLGFNFVLCGVNAHWFLKSRSSDASQERGLHSR